MKDLPNSPFLTHLDSDEINALASCGKYFDVEDGLSIIEEGKDQDHLFVLCQGHAKIMQKKMTPTVTAKIGPGESFGEINLFDFDGTGASASVIAEGKCRVWYINREGLNSFMEQDDSVNSRLLMGLVIVLSKRIRRGNKIVEGMASSWGGF